MHTGGRHHDTILTNPTQLDEDGREGLNAYIPRDAFQYFLGYHGGDYRALTEDSEGLDMLSGPLLSYFNPLPDYGSQPARYRGLYNGNIAYMAVNIPVLGEKGWQLNGYRYDQLHRLCGVQGLQPEYDNTGDLLAFNPAYRSGYRYDNNGNITELWRTAWHAGEGRYRLMDSLLYHYDKQGTDLKHNRLLHVNDRQPLDALFAEDMDDQGAYATPSDGNYGYDARGNLARDLSEGIDTILWNVYGKIREVRYAGGQPVLRFMYDASGHRTGKLLINSTTGRIDRGDLYWRDAQGNALVVESYVSQQEEEEMSYIPMKTLASLEYSMYGSSRLGIKKDTVTETYQADELSTRGTRQYELANHLGNVMVTVGDYKEPHTEEEDLYASLVLTAQDYYPFGMQMPGRKYSYEGNTYKYSFNGQEQEPEIDSAVTSAEFWMYDGRLGRRWNVDPVDQVSISNYAVMANNPVYFIDPKGQKWKDPKKADALKEEVNKKIKDLNSKIRDNEYKLNNPEKPLSEKQIKKIETQNEEYMFKINQLQRSSMEIDQLGEDEENTYDLVAPMSIYGANRIIKSSDGTILIQGSSSANHIHEIKHVIMSLRSPQGLQFNKQNLHSISGNGLTQEVQAYIAQWAFDSNSLPNHLAISTWRDITPEWIADLKDEYDRPFYPAINNLVYPSKNKR